MYIMDHLKHLTKQRSAIRMSRPINTLPISAFLSTLKAAELSQQREIKLDIQTARVLAICLGEVTARLAEDYDTIFQKLSSSLMQDVTIKFDGGSL